MSGVATPDKRQKSLTSCRRELGARTPLVLGEQSADGALGPGVRRAVTGDDVNEGVVLERDHGAGRDGDNGCSTRHGPKQRDLTERVVRAQPAYVAAVLQHLELPIRHDIEVGAHVALAYDG